MVGNQEYIRTKQKLNGLFSIQSCIFSPKFYCTIDFLTYHTAHSPILKHLALIHFSFVCIVNNGTGLILEQYLDYCSSIYFACYNNSTVSIYICIYLSIDKYTQQNGLFCVIYISASLDLAQGI